MNLHRIFCGVLLLTVPASVAAAAPVVPTRFEDVVETMHGVQVHDPYRWLEKADDAEVKGWTEQQNAIMRKTLDAVPGRKWIEERFWQLHEIGSLGVPVPQGKGDGAGKDKYFYTRRTGKQNQAVLYMRDTLGGADRVLVDVNKLAADGTRSLDWWFPSEDAKRVAYGT